MDKNFNVIITGVGGQGVITIVSVLDEACTVQGYDVRSSELHGLSQRGGSVVTHVRFGKRVYSPLVPREGADLIIGLEIIESLRDAIFSNPKTVFIVNDYSMPFAGCAPIETILSELKKIAGKNLHIVPADKDCTEKLQKGVVATMHLLGYATVKKLLPLKKESILRAIKNIIPAKHQELNIKAFELGCSYGN